MKKVLVMEYIYNPNLNGCDLRVAGIVEETKFEEIVSKWPKTKTVFSEHKNKIIKYKLSYFAINITKEMVDSSDWKNRLNKHIRQPILPFRPSEEKYCYWDNREGANHNSCLCREYLPDSNQIKKVIVNG